MRQVEASELPRGPRRDSLHSTPSDEDSDAGFQSCDDEPALSVTDSEYASSAKVPTTHSTASKAVPTLNLAEVAQFAAGASAPVQEAEDPGMMTHRGQRNHANSSLTSTVTTTTTVQRLQLDIAKNSEYDREVFAKMIHSSEHHLQVRALRCVSGLQATRRRKGWPGCQANDFDSPLVLERASQISHASKIFSGQCDELYSCATASVKDGAEKGWLRIPTPVLSNGVARVSQTFASCSTVVAGNKEGGCVLVGALQEVVSVLCDVAASEMEAYSSSMVLSLKQMLVLLFDLMSKMQITLQGDSLSSGVTRDEGTDEDLDRWVQKVFADIAPAIDDVEKTSPVPDLDLDSVRLRAGF